MKKIAIILLIILALLAVGAGVYFAVSRSGGDKSDLPKASGFPDPELGRKNNTSSKLKTITGFPIEAFWSGSVAGFSTPGKANSVFAMAKDGRIFFYNGATTTVVSDAIVQDVIKVAPSPDGGRVFVLSADSEGMTADVFSMEEKKWAGPMPDIIDAAWLPNSKKLVYLQKGKGTATDLFVKDFSDKKQVITKISSLHQADISLLGISQDRILIMPSPAKDIVSDSWVFSIKDKTMSKFVSGYGLMMRWSLFGDRGFKFTAARGEAPAQSLIIDSKGETTASLRFKTLPEKCFLASNTTMYCAIPREQDVFDQLDLPDSYLQKEVYLNDSFYQIDFAQNLMQPLYDQGDGIDAAGLWLSDNSLYFINRYDGKLYSLGL